ncbi:MAG: BMP family ABC transporter substrate-binding protein [Synergistaceae bacterium]|jgi:basic membrane protein A|nr:BMP family ABC transporter substrate-binding protein [Synergistaceae bacterium]
MKIGYGRVLLAVATVLAFVALGLAAFAGAASAADGKPRIAVVVNQKFGDKGPMDDLAKGTERARKDFGVEVKLLESSSAANFEEDVRAMARDGYDLVATTFPYMTDATRLIAAEYPDTKFAAIFQFVNVGGVSVPNIWDTEFHGEAAFYIGGYMCGRATKSGRVGLVIGGEEPTPNAEGNAFMRGVKAANPNASVDFAFVGSYEDPAKAKEITNAMISNGCDIVQTDAGASNAGVVEAAKEAGILCAGEITDFYDTYQNFTGIIGIGFGDTIYTAIKALVDGNYTGGHGIRDLSNGGYFMDWASYERFANSSKEHGEAFKPAIEEAKRLEKQITDGSLAIDFDTAVPNWGRISGEE